MQPDISVVMPVYNSERHIVDAVASIAQQSFTNWEMICIDDGSSDSSGSLLDWLATQDSRIHVIHQRNGGLVNALNRGCSVARAPLICRMDNDDIAFPERLMQQKSYFDSHSDCVVLGGSILEIDGDGDPLAESHLPTEHAGILHNLMHRKTGHFHPTTMLRTSAFHAAGGYRQQYEWVEDHDLWLRMARQGQLANLASTVLCYRQHASSICWQRSAQQRTLMNMLLKEAYQAAGRELPSFLIADSTQVRSPAGPGKWARAAAKGGFVKSAIKHLWQLHRSNARLNYRARISIEVALRLLPGMAKRAAKGEALTVPQFPTWQKHAAAFAKSASATTRKAA